LPVLGGPRPGTSRTPTEFGFRCIFVQEKPMRTIGYALALVLGLAFTASAFTASAFAADVTAAKTKADCDKAGGMWDATTNTCKAKQ
jgi:hypothetical protein